MNDYKPAKVERSFQFTPGLYWVYIPGVGTRKLQLAGDQTVRLGDMIQVKWSAKDRHWIKKS